MTRAIEQTAQSGNSPDLPGTPPSCEGDGSIIYTSGRIHENAGQMQQQVPG